MPFDAYHKWLAIPPAEQPPNHYRLLGLPLFESDQEVIAAAAVQRMNWVRKFQKGETAQTAQKIAKEITDAWARLLNVEQKRRYDAELKKLQDTDELSRTAAIAALLPPVAGPPSPPRSGRNALLSRVEVRKRLVRRGVAKRRSFPWHAAAHRALRGTAIR